MRFPSFPNIVRTLYTFTTATALRFQPLRGNTFTTVSQNLHRATVLRSMPSIPFLGALFGTSTPASAKMSYPDQRSDDEWRAVLNKGTVVL
jgi:peptide-methionine (R)-S-oxide reductase